MAQDFKINATTFARITHADWADDSAGSGLDGTTARLRWVRHVWSAPEGMTAAEYDALFAFQGQRVTLTTTNYEDRNGDFIPYYGAVCERVDGVHSGPVVAGVVAEFRVRL